MNLETLQKPLEATPQDIALSMGKTAGYISSSTEKLIAPRENTAFGFHLNGHTIGFHPRTPKLEPPCAALKKYLRKVLLGSFHLNREMHLRKIEPPGKLLELT